MLFKKNKEDKKIDITKVNELVKVSKKCLDILLILLIFVLILVGGKILLELGVLKGIKTFIKILMPFFIGFVIAWLLNPIVEFFEKRGIKRKLSTFLVFFLFILLIFLFVYLVIPGIGRQIQDAIGMIPNILTNIKNFIDGIFDKFTNMYEYDFTAVKESIYLTIENYTETITSGIPNFIINLVTKVISGGLTFALSLFISFYLLFDFNNVRKSLTNFLPTGAHKTFNELLDRLDYALKNYVLGTLFVTIILFIFQSLGFLIAGLKAPLVFGLICAITNIIPYVGPYIGGIPAVVVGYTMSPLTGTLTLVSVLIPQFLESYILTPLILSKTMKLHPVTIIIGLLVFEHFFGILGMLISIPVISCLKIIILFIDEKYMLLKRITK